MDADKHFVVGVFDDEDILLSGIKKVRKSGVKIQEVYSPFPVHGIDDALGYKKSRLPIAAFLFGMTGTTLALTMQIGMLGFDWPMIIGLSHSSAFEKPVDGFGISSPSFCLVLLGKRGMNG